MWLIIFNLRKGYKYKLKNVKYYFTKMDTVYNFPDINIESDEFLDWENIEIFDPITLINDFDYLYQDEIKKYADEGDINQKTNKEEDHFFKNQFGGNNFTVEESSPIYREKWKSNEYRFRVKFNSIDTTFSKLNHQILDLFHQINDFIKLKAKKNDKVRVIFDHSDFFSPISSPYMYQKDITAQFLLDLVDRVMQSHKTIRFNQLFKLWIHIANVPSGSGYSKNETYLINKSNCVKLIVNKDNFCAVRAILTAIKSKSEKNSRKYFNIQSESLDKETQKIVKLCGIPDKPCTIKEIIKIEMYLRDYQINIIDEYGNFIYTGPQNKNYVYIWLVNDHYYTITNISRFFNFKFWCDFCKKGYTESHKCEKNCSMCNRQNCTNEKIINCRFCNNKTKNETCLKFHQNKFCVKAKICEKCDGIKSKNHVCENQKWCKNCNKPVDKDNHECYLLTEKEKKKNKNQKFSGYIFFDYECSQEFGEHVPNLICAVKVCLNCLSVKKNDCKICEKVEFEKNSNFCDWLFDQPNYIAIAHNMKGYDGIFIMNYIINNKAPFDSEPFVICQGSKILCIRYRNVKIIDSYSFIPIPLSDFPSAFGISEEKKGFFPHLFNKKENQSYVGQYPSEEFYGCEYFKEERLREFKNWYSSVKNNVFDFQKEIKEYCWSDVELLSKGCLSFRNVIKETTKSNTIDGIDPFLECITIASLCQLIYRKDYLESKTIPYIPERGSYSERNSSYKSNLWLAFMMKKYGLELKSSLNGGEYQFGKYFVDGYDEENSIIYEFHGCFFHGCPRCFSSETFNPRKQKLMGSIFHQHKNRISFLKKKCKKLVEIWECEFDELIKQDSELQEFAKKYKEQPPINIRDALFGGRTNAVKLYYMVKDGEKIRYFDFTSLYPFVQKYCTFPVGHPIRIRDNFKSIENYFGIVKCKILPPKGLYLPVLPKKIHNKLIFTLCYKCAEHQLKKCNHNDENRSFIGTWVTLEVQKAVEKGYRIIEYYEVLHWDKSSTYDPIKKTGGIFTGYINKFLQYKQESSGYSKNVTTEEEKNNYIDNYYEKEGIRMDANNIKKNPSKRFVFKLILNSMWGRLGMNIDRNQYKVIVDPKEWFKMISDDNIIITHADHSNDNCLQVFYKNKYSEESIETSVVHAAFVTCHARLKLYSEMEKLGNRLLYFDTDSIIFIDRKNEYIPSTGDFLGELTDELEDSESNHIVEFVSAGPKNYGYVTKNNELEIKVKGICQYAKTAEKINFESIKKIVINNQKDTIQVDQLKFKIDKRPWSVICKKEKKEYGFVYDKRVLLNDLSTLPFGF